MSEGKSFPVETVYLGPPGRNFGDLRTLRSPRCDARAERRAGRGRWGRAVLSPGAAEINRVVAALRDGSTESLSVLPLYGALGQAEQQAALAPAPGGTRRVVVSTPIAESSLTIPGVRIVVDSGLARRPKFDSNKGMTRLDTALISVASADQRRGRAGRGHPGRATGCGVNARTRSSRRMRSRRLPTRISRRWRWTWRRGGSATTRGSPRCRGSILPPRVD